ncbi:unnamed protein product [Parnassius mnemosyne]|uniref:Reverse transcriptase domain-containing protein n=1 Tax=Parnassius mnemosyne TaxID=213953 RepID=A0AAV1L0P2_9NEOP
MTEPSALPRSHGRIKPKGLSLISFNIRGLRNNLPELKLFLKDREADFLLLQETNLKHTDNKGLSIKNYSLLRNDRHDRRGGGTAIYYKKTLHCSLIDTPQLTNMEATLCRISMTGHQSLVIASCYIPPKNLPLKDDFEAILSQSNSVIMFGDFNSKHTEWTCRTINTNGRILRDITQSLDLTVFSPLGATHYPDNTDYNPDVLDFALLKGVSLNLRSIETLDDIGSDHRPVSLILGHQPPPIITTKTFTNWKGFKDSLAKAMDSHDSPNYLSSDLDLDSPVKIDTAVESLSTLIKSSLKENERVVPVANTNGLPLYISNILKAKKAAFRRAAKYPTPEYRHTANRLQRKLRSHLYEFRELQRSELMENISPSHTAYYQMARALRIDATTHTPPLSRPDGTVAFEDDEKAECFADSIAAQCSPSSQPVDPSHIQEVEDEVRRRNSPPTTSDPITVSNDEISSLIKGLKPKKSPGADGISNQALKYFPEQVLTLLAIIFNACFNLSYFPTSWKEAIVIGIPKPGKPLNLPSSHRPISLLKAMGKLFERVIQNRMRRHLFPTDGDPIVIPHQFGFRAKHSCPQQVHRIVEYILSGFYPRRLKTIAVFFDIAKAFDRVWHEGLIFKLYRIGLSDRLVRLVASYLQHRTFRFRHEGTLSSQRPIKAGVPQGSVLAPLLYILYTNDIPIPSNGVQLSLFADDTALYFKSPRISSARNKIQKSVDDLGDWFQKWRIDVNPEKSSAVQFDIKRRRNKNKKNTPPIRMLGTPVPWHMSAKYLGVTLDYRLTFESHVKRVTRLARFYLGRLNSMLGRHSKMSLRNKRTLYKVCIRPVMTYSAPIFAHANDKIINELQVVQNLFCRRATNAPWYVRNADLHRDLEIPTIQQCLKKFSENFFKVSESHTNTLIREAVTYTAPLPSRYSVRRPRNTLLDPPNKLSNDLNCLLAAQANPN